MFEYQESRPTKAVYSLLSQAIEIPAQVPEEIVSALKDVYQTFSLRYGEWLAPLVRLEEAGKISAEDKLYLFVLFSTARTIGPFTLREIQLALTDEGVGREDLLKRIDGLIFDSTIKTYLSQIAQKIRPAD